MIRQVLSELNEQPLHTEAATLRKNTFENIPHKHSSSWNFAVLFMFFLSKG